MFTPRELDLKSLTLHQLVVTKIRSEPELFFQVRERLEQFAATAAPQSAPYIARWLSAFDRGMEEALCLAIEDTERGQVMRSCSPFSGVLTEVERLNFLRRWVLSRDSARNAPLVTPCDAVMARRRSPC